MSSPVRVRAATGSLLNGRRPRRASGRDARAGAGGERALRALAVLVAAVTATAVLAPAAKAQVIAIEGGTVHTMVGPPIANGTVLIRDGLIAEVGSAVAVPAGAKLARSGRERR